MSGQFYVTNYLILDVLLIGCLIDNYIGTCNI